MSASALNQRNAPLSSSVAAFFEWAQRPEYVMTGLLSGINTVEPGRKGEIHCWNKVNRAEVLSFVNKTGLNMKDTHLRPKEFIGEVKDALNDVYGKENVDLALSKHHEPYRFFEGIASYICHTYNFVSSAVLLLELGKLDAAHAEYTSIKYGVGSGGSGALKFSSPIVVDKKSQDISAEMIGAGKRVLQVVAASDCGVFGDPPYSITTQEEGVARSMSIIARLHNMFINATYFEGSKPAKTKNGVDYTDNISRFQYYPDVAPGDGKVIYLVGDADGSGVATRVFALTAALNNKRGDISTLAQQERFTLIFARIYTFAAKWSLDIVGAALGLGVFKCDPAMFNNALNVVRGMFESGGDGGSAVLAHVIGFWIPNRANKEAVTNFNALASNLGCPLIG